MELLRDPVWQFVGAIISLIAIIVSIWFFFLQKKKSLFFSLPEILPLLTMSDEKIVGGKIKLSYEGKVVDQPYIVLARFQNDGDLPITKLDFVEQLNILFPLSSRVLHAEMLFSDPSDLKLDMKIKNNTIVISPLLLNSGDTFIVKSIVADSNETPYPLPSARIVGIRQIGMPNRKSVRGLLWSMTIGYLLVAIGVIWDILLLTNMLQIYSPNLIRDKFIIQFLLIVLGSVIILGSNFSSKRQMKKYSMTSMDARDRVQT